MKVLKIITEKDPESGNTLRDRHNLTSFQAELASLISDAALKNFKDLTGMDSVQAKRFGRLIRNYSSNLMLAIDKLAFDARNNPMVFTMSKQ